MVRLEEKRDNSQPLKEISVCLQPAGTFWWAAIRKRVSSDVESVSRSSDTLSLPPNCLQGKLMPALALFTGI